MDTILRIILCSCALIASGQASRLKKCRCIPVQLLRHGNVTLSDGRLCGSVAKYTCGPGLALIDPSKNKKTCVDRVWIPRGAIRCKSFGQAPPDIRNGILHEQAIGEQRIGPQSQRYSYNDFMPLACTCGYPILPEGASVYPNKDHYKCGERVSMDCGKADSKSSIYCSGQGWNWNEQVNCLPSKCKGFQSLCQNGAHCTINGETSYPYCECLPGTYGMFCERKGPGRGEDNHNLPPLRPFPPAV
ncbi:unnamed protein product [Owenia fusiformis]|uniref:Uncharacterized protein n=1 Tax=Owenia fusiformis TaxID=6347 RepID=A0A8J1YBD3_OWEFU|nr:unnamed protein product [Owenia fusiformis]